LVERTRIAREIHDTLLQGVAGASLLLEVVRNKLADVQLRSQLDGVLRELHGAMVETRQALWEIRSKDVRHNLAEGLEEFGSTLASDLGVKFGVEISGTPKVRSATLHRELLRIGQEAILNAARHSHASEIRVSLRADGGTVRIVVDDDGCGFDPAAAAKPGHWGLAGMRERAKQLGGVLDISSRAGGPTSVTVSVPAEPDFRES
jgi:signal transduction histidine kinase